MFCEMTDGWGLPNGLVLEAGCQGNQLSDYSFETFSPNH